MAVRCLLFIMSVPKHVGILFFNRIGEDQEISGQHSILQTQQTSIIPNIQDYVTVKDDDHW